MKLSYISISYYRSITSAYKIALNELTVLIGKNNEGKTNILKAINMGMSIISNAGSILRRKIISKQIYDWYEDFPINLQNSKKLKKKNTSIRMDFEMSNEELQKLNEKINSNINRAISIYINISEDNSISLTVPKRGKNTKALSTKVVAICDLICEYFDIQFIAAIRSESDAYEAIYKLIDTDLSSINDVRYKEAVAYIEEYQAKQLRSLAVRIKKPLGTFLPQIKSMNLFMTERTRQRGYMFGKTINIEIDDGVLTNFSNKGDGVKSLVTIAMLSQVESSKDRIIIVDEPENHLHPDAIRFINNVICDLSQKNQIIVSTHNPILVNRIKISSNIIVENGEAISAKRVDDIRKSLGVICSDNLMYSDYVVVVEGPSDRDLMTKVFIQDSILREALHNKIITIRSIGGTDNLRTEIYNLEHYCCNYLIVLDNDSAAKNAANEVKRRLGIAEAKFRYFIIPQHRESELEDLYNPDFYREYLLREGFNISDNIFKNKSKKWSDKISNLALNNGQVLDKETEDRFKKELVNMANGDISTYLSGQGVELLHNIGEKIKTDLNLSNS